MHSKVFEIRDAGTFIVVVATPIAQPFGSNSVPEHIRERWLVRRGGWESGTIALTRLGSRVETEWDPVEWKLKTHTRTLTTAHQYIKDNWESLRSGALICVETILGLRDTPKETEQERAPDYARFPGGLVD
jgi:hypothetical protein